MLSCRKFDIHRKAIQFSCRPPINDNEPTMNDSHQMKDFDFYVVIFLQNLKLDWIHKKGSQLDQENFAVRFLEA